MPQEERKSTDYEFYAAELPEEQGNCGVEVIYSYWVSEHLHRPCLMEYTTRYLK